MAWLASTASEGEEGDPFLERPDAVSVLRRYANWLHTEKKGKKKKEKKNMSTVRYIYTDTTGYAEYVFRINRTVEYFTEMSRDNDIPTITLLCVHRPVVFGATLGSHGHDREHNCIIAILCSLTKCTDVSD
jgi:hypothetical protein